MSSRYFTRIPNRFTGAALTAPTDATQTTTMTNLFGATAVPTNPVTGVWTVNTQRILSNTAGFVAGTPYIIWNRNITFGSTGTTRATGGSLTTTQTAGTFGVHVWFVNCNIVYNYAHTSADAQWWPMAMFDGGTAPFRAAAAGTTIAVGSNVASSTNSFSFWGCTVTNQSSNGAGGCLDIRFCTTDLIHTDIINNTFGNTAGTAVFEPVVCSSAQIYGSTFNGSNSLQPSNFHNEGYGIAYSPTLLNGLATSAGLATGVAPISYVSSSPAAYGNTQVGVIGGTLQVHDYIFTGLSKSDAINTTAVTAAGTQVMTNKSLSHMEANQNGWWTSLTLQDPITQPDINQAATSTPQNWFETRFSGTRGAFRYIASSTISPYVYTNLLNPTGSPTANVKLQATYGSSFTTAGTITTITNVAPASASVYLTNTTGRLSTASTYDPYDGNVSTVLGTNGLRTPYVYFTPNANPANDSNIAVYSTQQVSNGFDMRAAGRLINNGTTAYTFTVNTAAATSNATGLPLITNVPAPVRPEAATAFVTAATTSDDAMDTYFGTFSGKSVLTNGWNTQDFGDYVDYRWSRYDTNANPVYYDNSYLNLGSQSVTIDNGGVTGFNTASQTWTIRSNVLGFNTANGGASLGGLTTTGTVTMNSVYNVSGTYAPILGGSIVYNANGTILQSVRALGQNGTPASWRTNSNLGSGTGSGFSFTATLPSGLGAASVTTSGITITGTAATDIPVIQNAMDAALDAAGVSDISIAITTGTGTFATITYSGTYTVFNSTYSSGAVFNVPNAAGTGSVACTISASGSWATQASGMANIVTALNANATFTGAGWTATTDGTTVTMTRGTSGPLAFTTVSVSGQNANWLFNMPSWTIALVNGTTGGSVLRATFIAAVPAVGGVVPTTALQFTSSPATYLTGPANPAVDMIISSVAGSVGTITYPTIGTIINTSGTIRGSQTVTTTGSITMQGGFTAGLNTSGVPTLFTVNQTGSQGFTLTGGNTFNAGLSVLGGSTGLITLGSATDTPATTTTYATDTTGLHAVTLTGSTAGGQVAVYSGNIVGGTGSVAAGLTPTGYNVILGSNYYTGTTTPKLSVNGTVGVTAYASCTVDGFSACVTGGTFQIAGLTNANISVQRLNIGGTGVKQFLMSGDGSASSGAATTGTTTIQNSTLGGGTVNFRLGTSSAALVNTTCSAPVVTVGGGTLGFSGGSVFSGSLTSSSLTSLLATGNSSLGVLALSGVTSATLGNAAGAAVLTSGGSLLNSTNKATTYTIGNLDLTGTLAIAQAISTARTITPVITMRAGAILSIDATLGANNYGNNLTIDCAGVTFANAAATFLRADAFVAGQEIKLLNWPAGKTIPNGFKQNVNTVVTLVINGAPAVAPTIQKAEAYKNGGSTNILAGLTPTYLNGTFTWPNILSSSDDTINGAIFFVDGYQITRGTSTSASNCTATAVKEDNVDFGQTIQSRDTTFIGTTSWSTSNAFLASNPYVLMTTSTTVDYTTTPTTRTAVELAKLVLRRSMETTDSGTVEMRRAMAFGTLPVDFFRFAGTGLSVTYVTGLGTTGVGLKINKVSNVSSQNAVVTWSIWAVDNLGDFYVLNSANGRSPTTPTTLILWEGFSPGAVANLTTGQINQIGSGVSSVLTASGGPLRVLADGVQDASLVIPTTITFS